MTWNNESESECEAASEMSIWINFHELLYVVKFNSQSDHD